MAGASQKELKKQDDVKSSSEILDEIFKVLKFKSESRESELNGKDLTKVLLSEIKSKDRSADDDVSGSSSSDDDSASSSSSKRKLKKKSSKSSKHHKKHKKHKKHHRRKHKHKHKSGSRKSPEKADEAGKDEARKHSTCTSKDEELKSVAIVSTITTKEISKSQQHVIAVTKDIKAIDISKDPKNDFSSPVTTLDGSNVADVVILENEQKVSSSKNLLNLTVAEKLTTVKEQDAASKRTLQESCEDDHEEVRDQIPRKKAKTKFNQTSSAPIMNVDSSVPGDGNNSSNEREEGEVSDDGNSGKSDTSSNKSQYSQTRSLTSPIKSNDATDVVAEINKKHKKSKHKKKKKKRSKEIKRFTSPLTVGLISRSRRLSLATRRSSSPNARSRSRSRSRSHHKERSLSRDRISKPRVGFRYRSRSRSLSAERKRSLRAGTPINKVRLLEIARKNALQMMADGRIPAGLPLPTLEKDSVVAIKAGGKSLAELNDFCKYLSKKESEGGDGSGDEEKSLFIHHPFKPREHQPNIVMNIKNAVQIPVKTSAEKVAEGSKLRIQFPVSSGTQHRKKESEWVPVSPDKEELSKSVSSTAVVPIGTTAGCPAAHHQVFKKPTLVNPKEPLALTAPPMPSTILTPAAPLDSVFPMPSQSLQSLDIGSIVSQRLKAVRKLKDNPHDVEALCQMYKSQQEMTDWAQSKQLPGQFTGSTDVTILTPQQLAGPAHLQAWVKKDQFSRIAPVRGGVGMQMLQKMGWKPGEGLGKNSEGQAEPIILDIKLDKKGLVSQEELNRNVRKPNMKPTVKDLSGKHPVSALVELCNKRRWGVPDFQMVFDSGPDHKKNFVFKVKVNGVEYQPTIASLSKKHGKAQCATVCLQALGLLPRDFQNPI